MQAGRNAPEPFVVEWVRQSDMLWYARVSLSGEVLAAVVEGYEGDEWIARAPEYTRIPSAIGNSRDDALARMLARRPANGNGKPGQRDRPQRPRLDSRVVEVPKRGASAQIPESLNPDALRELYRALDGLVALVTVPEMFGTALYSHDPGRTISPLVEAAERALEAARRPVPARPEPETPPPGGNDIGAEVPPEAPSPAPPVAGGGHASAGSATATRRRRRTDKGQAEDAALAPAAPPPAAPEPPRPLFRAVERRTGKVAAEGLTREACGDLALTHGGASYELRRDGDGWRAWAWSGSARGKWFRTALASAASDERAARREILEAAAGHPGWDALDFEPVG